MEETGTRHLFKRIAVDHLEIGMFVEDVVDENGVVLIAGGELIRDPSRIDFIRKRGVREVCIDAGRGLDSSHARTIIQPATTPAAAPSASVSRREEAYFRELKVAKDVHREAIVTVKESLHSVRLGKSFSTGVIRKLSERMVESVTRNADALTSLSQLKGYDEYTYTHSINVGILMTSLAFAMGYGQEDLLEIGIGGLLHDIGKMKIPERILNKPGTLTSSEFSIIKRHPQEGLAILDGKPGLSPIVRTIVIQHHERYDGRGYPRGLRGGQIEEVGVISAVADVYDALTSDRVYRTAWTPQKALATIFQGCDREYSRRIVELFTKNLGIYPVGSFVKLFSGEMGIVVRVDKGNLLAPTVLILFDERGKRRMVPVEYDLARLQTPDENCRYTIIMSCNPKTYKVNVNDYLQKSVS